MLANIVAPKCFKRFVNLAWKESSQRNWMRRIARVRRKHGSKSKIRGRRQQLALLMEHSDCRGKNHFLKTGLFATGLLWNGEYPERGYRNCLLSKLTVLKVMLSDTSRHLQRPDASARRSKVSYVPSESERIDLKIMFGVLVVVLCPDRVADLGFITSERQIPLIVFLRVLRALRFGAGGTRCPPLRACGK